MAEGADHDDRTEPPTEKRLRDAREEGRVALSREVPSAAVLAAGALALSLAAPAAGAKLGVAMSAFLSQAHRMSVAGGDGALGAAMASALLAAAMLLVPFAVGAMVAGVASIVLQTGIVLSPKAIMPDFTRISPRSGLKRLLSPETLIEGAKSVAKIAAVGIALWRPMSRSREALAASTGWTLPHLLAGTADLVLRVTIAVLVVQTGIAAIDFFLVRRRHDRSLRMSRDEIKREAREADGDPRIKARIKQLRLQRARRRMLDAVPTATVVITNPTHYAVALAYDRTRNAAPHIVAKGANEVAARIRVAAEEARVPMVANPALARALFTVELDADIPAEHFQAVAEIIAYVWRIDRRVRHGR